MYDKIKLLLPPTKDKEAIAQRLEAAKEQINIDTGEVFTFGGLQGLKVCCFSWGTTITGSLAKFLLPNNIYTLDRHSTQEAIEKLCDLLGVDVGGAAVTGLEFGTNFMMRKPVGIYLEKLGEMPKLIRLPVEASSLYYKHRGKEQPKALAFYDKIKDAKAKGFEIPTGFDNTNLLRYELKLNNRIDRQLKLDRVTASTLSNGVVYYSLLEFWRQMYFKISKPNQLRQNIMTGIKTPNEAVNVFLATLLATAPQTAVSDFVAELRAAGVFPDSKNYTRVKNKLEAVAKLEIATAPDEDIKELTNEINNVGVYG